MAKKKPTPQTESAAVDISDHATLSEAGFGALPFVVFDKINAAIDSDQTAATVANIEAVGFEAKVISLREYCADETIDDDDKGDILAEFEGDGIAIHWDPHHNGLLSGEWTLVALLNAPEDAIEADAIAILARAEAPEGERDRAKDFLIGNLIEASKRRFVNLVVPFRDLKEHEQTTLLRNLADDIRKIAGQTIKAIASNERLTFRAEVESVQFKGASDIKAALKLSAGPESHALADSAGGFVTVVIENVSELLEIPEAAVKGEADQKPLFDESTTGTAVDTSRMPVKYHDAETGSTWSGRGLKPKWLVAALAGGRSLSEFEVTA